MNERLNELRLDAGISRLHDDPRLVVIDREGNVIDPLIGLEKFAELIVQECMEVCADRGKRHGELYSAWASDCSERIGKRFGVES